MKATLVLLYNKLYFAFLLSLYFDRVVMKFRRARFGDNWTIVCQACDYNIQQKEVIIVKWIRPHFNTLKLNTRGGASIRSLGGLPFTEKLLGPGTSSYVVAAAMMYGLKWCSTHDSRRIWGETDLLLTNCINKETNKISDKLASLSHGSSGIQIFNSFSDLAIKGLTNIDKWGFSSLI
ncbi:hypothetical protein H5410_063042 [Solanum commersonii]|uniref:Uncharacterized protein n=1 Tax=Solanum commersonii TaxID=4109 RepID=A0A9J5WDA5_SOLCO|nr:hypothetical protein H5410_063042 [Solanum commersonii]